MSTNKESTIVGPLHFDKIQSGLNQVNINRAAGSPTSSSSAQSKQLITNATVVVPCLFCKNHPGNTTISSYQFPADRDEYLAHLFLIHKFVVADIEQVAILDEYLLFWWDKFQDASKTNSLEEYCTVMLLNQLPDGRPATDEPYYLLSDDLPLDYELRNRLHRKRLEVVLSRHQFERTDQTFERDCLFCRDVCRPANRHTFLEHLFQKHFLQIGKSENLVFIDELIDVIEDKMDRLICLYCEKVFKDRPTLKEHMRKKGHKRINPDNKSYDKYFLCNYKTDFKRKSRGDKAAALQAMVDSTSAGLLQSDGSDSDWSDWDGEKQTLTCLYCSEASSDFRRFKGHMLDEHEVNFDHMILGFDFYEKVKIVNFIRRQVHMKKCLNCSDTFGTSEQLLGHLGREKHFELLADTKELWNQPEFFFPTYEDDAVLCHLEDDRPTTAADRLSSNEDDSNETVDVVISEDSQVSVNADAEALSKENLFKF